MQEILLVNEIELRKLDITGECMTRYDYILKHTPSFPTEEDKIDGYYVIFSENESDWVSSKLFKLLFNVKN